jgi:hypothetical protein
MSRYKPYPAYKDSAPTGKPIPGFQIQKACSSS